MDVGIYEAKTRLANLVHLVEQGQTVTITNRGRPVADLVPTQSAGKPSTGALISEILAARSRQPAVSGAQLLAWKEEGRK
ncbi:MAG: hypothetical protein B7Z35_08155 [Hydrogenophilales bacterium 12-61-10]|nr:MAG: hypothetical protein B7Z35_08155 [Hydrogenophilales bacterium 12-61-10]